MHRELLIISEYDPQDIFQGLDHLWLLPPRRLLNKNTAVPDIAFDYLIFSALETLGEVKVLTDGGLVVTNYFFQTSRENFFCVGPLNGSKMSIEKQYERIKEYLRNPI